MEHIELSTSDPLALMTRHVRRWGLLKPHESVVVAVSGGADSTVLLALICDLAKEWKLEVTAAHLDHGINREMGEVAWRQTRELAERFGVRWFGRREDVLQLQENEGASLHQVARRVRYQFFTSVASEVGAGLIATGHTADDQAETVLMRLLRGTGPLGASGIPPKREISDVTIIRPLLAHRKKELEAYCTERELPFVEDPANVDVSFLRSRVRQEVIPLLEKVFGHDVVPHIAGFAERLREEQDALDREAEEVLSDPSVERTPTDIIIPRSLFESKPPSLQKRFILKALEALRGKTPRIRALHLESVVDAVARGRAGSSITFPGGFEAYVGTRAVRIGRSPSHAPRLEPVSLQCPGSTDVPDLEVRVIIEKSRPPHRTLPPERAREVYLGKEAIQGPLALRTRRPGDTIYPLGAPGRRKLKKVLIDRKVPRYKRGSLPVITTGEGADEEILWVVGVVLSESCRLAPDSTEAWRVKVEQMEERVEVAPGR